MLQEFASAADSALGLSLEAKDISALQMSLRAVVVFFTAAAMIRIGSKRFMGQSTALDVMLGIMFGSIVGRAITGNAPFLPTLAGGFTLIVLHWLISAIAFRFHPVGVLFKGTQSILVEDGHIQWDAMRRSHITEHDLHEAIRRQGELPDVSRIKSAHMERNGDISILMKEG